LTKPAKVFGLDENRVWKAQKLHGDTYALADLGENETPEPPDAVAVKLPREVIRQVGRYKEEGETLKVAAERLILKAIAQRDATTKITNIPKNSNRFPIMVPMYLPTAQLKELDKVFFWKDDDTYQKMVFFAINDFIKRLGGTVG
jgi:hypothetical protein